MATAQPTLPRQEEESDMTSARQLVPPNSTVVQMEKGSMNLMLLAILIAMGVFPFVVGFLPRALIQHLDVLFR